MLQNDVPVCDNRGALVAYLLEMYLPPAKKLKRHHSESSFVAEFLFLFSFLLLSNSKYKTSAHRRASYVYAEVLMVRHKFSRHAVV